MRYHFVRGFAALALAALSTAPALAQDKVPDQKAPPALGPPPFHGIGIAFVANGSGDSYTLTDNLRDALREAHQPFAVDTIRWSLGMGARPDHDAVERHAEFAAVLAGKVTAFRKFYPDKRIVLIGHSSGTHVILLAAASLPENSVDRIVLLAPSVACNYDLRPALRCARDGVDVYWSDHDTLLDAAAAWIGTADRQRGVPAAGRVGFATAAPNSPDAMLYAKLHQFQWYERLRRLGHGGGHFGWLRTPFLRECVVPRFTIAEMAMAPAKK